VDPAITHPDHQRIRLRNAGKPAGCHGGLEPDRLAHALVPVDVVKDEGVSFEREHSQPPRGGYVQQLERPILCQRTTSGSSGVASGARYHRRERVGHVDVSHVAVFSDQASRSIQVVDDAGVEGVRRPRLVQRLDD
jgi:hypothetical protein